MARIAQFGDARAVRAEISSFRLLCLCCRQYAGASAELEGALRASINWDEVLRLVSCHRVLPAIHTALCRRDDVPGSVASALSARYSTHITRVMRFSAELIRILQKFEEHRIEVISHKGPVMAQRLYADPAMREFGDLDLLVRPADVPRARTALCELDFSPNLKLSARQEREYLRTGYEFTFGSGTESNLVELQWQLAPRFYAFNFEMASLFERSVTVDFHGFPVRILRDEDLMLALCAHAAKHQWSQLSMLRDIATLTGAQLDWRWIQDRARRLGILRILLLTLEMASRLLGTTIPETFNNLPELRKVQNSSWVGGLDRNIRRDTERGTDGSYFRTMLKIREHWRDRVRFALRLLTTPEIGEWQTVSLPDMLFPLYRGVRAWRLTRRLLFRDQKART